MSTSDNQSNGRGSNLTDEDRKKGGEHSHQGQNEDSSSGKDQGRGSNLTDEDRKKGSEQSHGGGRKDE